MVQAPRKLVQFRFADWLQMANQNKTGSNSNQTIPNTTPYIHFCVRLNVGPIPLFRLQIMLVSDPEFFKFLVFLGKGPTTGACA